jgi:hypothetical protein
MKKSAALPILLLVVLLVIAAIAEAQQPGNVLRIGFYRPGHLTLKRAV